MRNKKTTEVRESFSQDVEKVADSRKQLSEEEKIKRRENAVEYHFYWSLISEAISELVELNKKWINCYIEFWGWEKRLYSVDINTEDDGYLQLYWKTKFEKEMEREKQRQEGEARRKREELEAIEKIPWWVEEGKKYIDESKWWDWEKYVNNSARDMYHWMDIDATLELLKMIDNWESWESVQKAFDDQWHSGFSYSVVRNRVVYFSKRWPEADKKLWGNW